MASDVREQAAFRRRTDLFASIVPSLNFTSQNRPIEETASGGASACPELDCLRGEFAPDLLAEAEQRALAVGVGAERVLIAAGAVGEEDYLRRLADALDLTFDSLDGVPRAHCPIDDERLIESAAAGMLPLKVGGELYLVVAPRGLATRRIMAVVEERPELARRIRFTTSGAADGFRVPSRRADNRRPRRRWAWRDVAASVRGAAALARQYRAGGHRRVGRDDGADRWRRRKPRSLPKSCSARCFSPGSACASPALS